jgi:putative ATP-binding cassette transporter
VRGILFLWRKSWLRLTLAFAASIAGGLANVGLVILLQSVISGKVAPRTPIALSFAGLCVAVMISRLASQLLLVHLSQRATFQLIMQLCRQIVATPLATLEQIGIPRLHGALTEDVSVLISGLVLMPGVLTQCTIVLLCLGYMTWLSPRMSGIVVLFLSVSWTLVHLAITRTTRSFALAWDDRNLLFEHFRSLLEGVKELKLHRQRQDAFVERVIPEAAESYERHNLKGTAVFNSGAALAQLLMFAAMALAVFLLPNMANGRPFVAGTFVILLLYLIVPLEYLASALPSLSRATVALKQIESLELVAPPTQGQRPIPPIQVSTGSEVLSLRGVTHRYAGAPGDDEFVLGPIDFSIHQGELVFIIGGNGSGKTTLAKILTGLYVPDTGEIRAHGMLVEEENRDSYRQSFSAVFQDAFLFDRLLGLDQHDAASRDFLSLLQLDGKVTISEGRFSTLDLSHGQRKRLALLVACVEDRPIYLFDEWAADQDPVFKRFFYSEMLPDLRRRGKTVIVISHDDRYYNAGARLVKLVDGMIEFDRPLADAFPKPDDPVLNSVG